jgi:nitrate/nitrite-specific signal transduction histidine kinase
VLIEISNFYVGTFNEMTEELMLQYQSLEEKVAERTRELEISKKAAEAANESKTLFIANISHELKSRFSSWLSFNPNIVR